MKELTKLFTVAVGVTILSTFLLNKAYAAPIKIEAADKNKVVGVRLKDFRRYAKTQVPRLKEISYMMDMQPELFFKSPVLQLHGTFFRATPEINGDIVTLYVDAMIAHNEFYKSREELGWPSNFNLTEQEEKDKTLRFRDVVFERITVSYKTSGTLSPVVNLVELIDLKDTEFQVNVAMIDRRVMLTDNRSSLRFTYPTGLGSFDDHTEFNDVRLLTPIYKNSFLDKRRAIFAREKPSYFEGKPFIRVTTKEDPSKGHTGIGFHIDQNKGSLVRGFVSHGCLRLREMDLYMMYDIVRFGTPQRISVNTRYRIAGDKANHPYPLKTSSYSRLKKYKLKKNVYYRRCKFCRGKLMKMEWASSPKLNSLIAQLIDTDDNGERPDGYYLFRVDEQGDRRDMQGRKVDKYGFPIDEKGRRIEEKESEEAEL